MDTSGVIQSLILLILVILSGLFSSAETALTTVSYVKMRTLSEDGNRNARLVLKILDKRSKMLSTVLIGNNIVNLSASALATTLAINISLPVGIATGLLTFIILIIGEIVPKTWAMVSAEKLSLFYCRPIISLMFVLTPAIYVVDKISSLLLKAMRIDPNKKAEAITEDEIRTYVEVGHEDGVIESEEKEMINNVFDFSDAVCKDIMIPKINMVTVSATSGYDEIMKVFGDTMYTRLPVYKDNSDNIIGFVNIKDMIFAKKANFKVEVIIRKALYTHEYKKISDLLYELREKSLNLAFVLNEYGTIEGMITLEDILEEIVGEIRDEYDDDERELIKKINDKEYLIEGSMKLDDINDALDIKLKSEDYDSLGGIVIEHLNRLPAKGEEVVLENGVKLKVYEMLQNRIARILLILPEENEILTQKPETEDKVIS